MMKEVRCGLHWRQDEHEVAVALSAIGLFPSEIAPLLPTIRSAGAVADHLLDSGHSNRRPGAYGAIRKPLPIRRGFDHPRARLNPHLIRRIEMKRAGGQSFRGIARDLGISRHVIQDFISGKSYRKD